MNVTDYLYLKAFAREVGGVNDWSYVMELQERGSPHIHLVLWTGKTAEELMEVEGLVSPKSIIV
jgi:hypothetical protein